MRGPLFLTLVAGALALAAEPCPAALLVYPDAETSFNPRVPCIAPVARAGGGEAMEVEANFRYQLAPFVGAATGQVHALVRDNGRRSAKDVIALVNGKDRLVLRVAAASAGGLPALVWIKGGRDAASAPFTKPLPREWTAVDLKWDATTASATLPGGESAQLKLAAPFSPQSVELQTALVAALDIDAGGKLTLDWTQGYAAQVEPAADSTATAVRLFGFDTFVISRDESKRDCPMVQVSNAGPQMRTVKLACSLAGEVNATHQDWSQDIDVPAKSSAMVALNLPASLPSDVYHLAVHSDSLQPPTDAKANFLFVEKRNEPAGPAKFGLHDSARNLYGAWPDALPVTFSTNYLSWGNVVGPPWVKDPGMNADTPPDQWNWNARIDWAIGQGLMTYVSLGSEPDFDWARARDYPADHMRKLPFGTLGGFPKLDLYRKFVHEVALRYKGKVHYYEVENEPMAHAGIPPDDYVQIAQAVSEEVHAVDPDAKVFGICGTGDFISWMTKVFDLGGAKVMDGVSIHTYVTPNMPERADLPNKLAAVDKLVAKSGKAMPVVNSETGTYIALREVVDHAITPEHLAELIKAGAPNLAVKSGWPFHAMDERSAGVSVVRNATYNFLAGAEFFTFFGYNPAWPPANWATGGSLFNGEHNVDDACWAMIAATKDGERTPSLFTLAVGEIMEQLNGAQAGQGKAIKGDGFLGGIFPKANGGEVAVLWSAAGERSALLESPDTDIEAVSMLGHDTTLTGTNGRFQLVVGDEPVYIHTKHPGLRLLPSPVTALAQDLSGERNGFHFTVVNTSQQPWQGSLALTAPQGWNVTLQPQNFSLPPGQRLAVKGTCEIPAGTHKGSYAINARTTLPDGASYEFPIAMDVRPSVTMPNVDAAFAWDQHDAWSGVEPLLKIDQPEQVAVGRSPLMASLQETKYWAGPQELSAGVRLASTPDDLLVSIDATDANMKLPATWPGVGGSCIELFLDARAPEAGLGQPAFGPGVHQLLIEPSDGAQRALRVADNAKSAPLTDVTATGSRSADGKYWLAIRIPWRSLGRPHGGDQTLGFDLGLDGPVKEGGKRKSQMMLFGTATNNVDASNFGFVRAAVGNAKLGDNK